MTLAYGKSVNKMDAIIGMYPSKLKVKRWHMNIYFHSIDLTMGNAWLLYNHENKRIHRRKKTMSQYQFKRLVAEAWMAQNAGGTQRRRKSRSITPVAPRGRRRGSPTVPHVPNTTRYDGKNHNPAATCGKFNRQRCALCKAQTTIYCTKCEVHLCVISRRNCFIPFHDPDYDSASPQPSDVEPASPQQPDVEPASPQQPSDDNPDSPPALNVEDLLCDESNEELLRYESNE